MGKQELIPHLFRTEYAKIVAVLCKQFGIGHLQMAEDIAGETFLSALETWPYKGIPANPSAWLYTVAKNKAKNVLLRQQIFSKKIKATLQKETATDEPHEIDLSEKNITDSQLQMLFAICNPAIPVESQIGLALKILCGFGIEEIANAFLTGKETINKRLYRAKTKLQEINIKIEMPAADKMENRLPAVLKTLYLLFSEGYYSESNDAIIREELCWEAMRLTSMLIENSYTNTTSVRALYALMCFHASRFPARKDNNGAIILYDDQDENLWDRSLIQKGAFFLNEASQGNEVTQYHLEAAIAYWHTVKTNTPEKWENILHLYNLLLQTAYSPIAALNRAYAFAKVQGIIAGINEAEKLQLSTNHYYYTLLGELYKETDKEKSIMFFEKAIALAKTQTDKETIRKKIGQIK